MPFRTLFLLLWALCACAQDFYLKNGDRVVFYGDSITDQLLYTTFAETYVVTRFPNLNVTFVHSGWGGDRVTGGAGGPVDVRLQRDVFAYKPTVMTIMLGMNDGAYTAWDEKLFETYSIGYRHIIQAARSAIPGLRITVVEPSPFDDVTRDLTVERGYNSVLIRYGQYLRQLAETSFLDIADLNSPLIAALAKANALDPEMARKIIPDRIHPAPAGHLLMATALLKAWNAPAVVTSVEIDAARHNVVRSANTEITELRSDAGGLSWVQADKALPMPLDPEDKVLALALRCSSFFAVMDAEPLRITGLPAKQYTLKIDDQAVGTFSGESLDYGINLASLRTPMAAQAAAVHGLTLKRARVHQARWRSLQVPLDGLELTTKQAALDALDKLDAELASQQRVAARPKPHRYELLPE